MLKLPAKVDNRLDEAVRKLAPSKQTDPGPAMALVLIAGPLPPKFPARTILFPLSETSGATAVPSSKSKCATRPSDGAWGSLGIVLPGPVKSSATSPADKAPE